MNGQALVSGELYWTTNKDIESRLFGCLLQFETEYVTFYETGYDANQFYANRPLHAKDKLTERVK